MDFGSRSGGLSPPSAADEHKLMAEVQQNMRAQMVQEFYQTVRDKCFKMCITSPSSTLSSSEQKCLGRCMDRYQEATNIITKSVLGQQ